MPPYQHMNRLWDLASMLGGHVVYTHHRVTPRRYTVAVMRAPCPPPTREWAVTFYGMLNGGSVEYLGASPEAAARNLLCTELPELDPEAVWLEMCADA